MEIGFNILNRFNKKMQIGNVIAETPPTIGKSEQLILHAGLGAITSSLTKNDAMSGMIAGVAGELTAELANENIFIKRGGGAEEL